MESDYLIHYGTPRKSGRYPFGSGKRPFQSLSSAVRKRMTPSARGTRINRRASKKLSKIEENRESGQKEADKYFDKAARKSTSFFSSQRGVDRAINRAANAQKSVNRLEYKGQRYYKKIQKKLSKLDQPIDPKVQKLGEQYIRDMQQNSKAIYNAMITNTSTGIKYRR